MPVPDSCRTGRPWKKAARDKRKIGVVVVDIEQFMPSFTFYIPHHLFHGGTKVAAVYLVAQRLAEDGSKFLDLQITIVSKGAQTHQEKSSNSQPAPSSS
jgi:hypothetical protein